MIGVESHREYGKMRRLPCPYDANGMKLTASQIAGEIDNGDQLKLEPFVLDTMD